MNNSARDGTSRARGAWVLVCATLAVLLLWRLVDVLLLAFAGVLLAMLLQLAVQPLQRRLGLRTRWALLLVILLATGVLALLTWLTGASLAEQLQALREAVPRSLDAARQWLGQHAVGRWLLQLWTDTDLAQADWQRLAGLATRTLNTAIGGAGALVLLVALGVYLAADPGTYRTGALKLLPPHLRPRAAQFMDAATHDLSRWLLGQALSMLAVGLATWLGLVAIGMPLALSLGLIAGLLNFVPYFGPVMSGALIVVVALPDGATRALYAALVCLAVQQGEAYVLQPLVQRWAVQLPPALALLAVLVFGLLFGVAGVLLAVPLMVLSVTAVNQLLVQRYPADEALGDG